jgi:sulfite reductase (NADPH) hemoprotein beta-component
MTMSDPKPLSDVERIKAASRLLRGTIAESLVDPVTGSIAPSDTHLIKFHGSYQQDDRDIREERRLQKLEPAFSFMVRTRLPGGICKPAQWLVLDEIARTWANGTLRLTTRQSFQMHGILKRDVKRAIQTIHAALIDTLGACGDVNRNVMCSPNPVASRTHDEVYRWAVALSEQLLPRTRAYHEIWLDEEKVEGGEDEPVYGATYLPRKFKAAIAVPPINDVDVFAHDLGAIAILEDGELRGFNVTAGGGMGATHGDATTHPRLADVLGFILPRQLLEVARTIVMVQRDFGDRSNRRRARLKYTIEDRGLAWFLGAVESRLGWSLEPARPFAFEHVGDRYGWTEGHDGRWHLTLHVESGRIADRPGREQLTGLREIARIHRGDFRLTPNQNLIIAGVAPEDRAAIEALADAHGLSDHRSASPLRLDALACVALPTCGLAMAEAERYLPTFIGKLEARLAAHGLEGAPIKFRVTGCPNGCARPYLAEIALVGKAPGRYNLHLGGDTQGRRLNTLHRENLDEAGIFDALDPLLAAYAQHRSPAESFGDFVVRTSSAGTVPTFGTGAEASAGTVPTFGTGAGGASVDQKVGTVPTSPPSPTIADSPRRSTPPPPAGPPMKARNILETIGNSPHVRINRLFPSRVEVYMKLERANPGGSIKDRIALSMIEDAERQGLIGPGSVIIEPTSGNTGIGLAMVAAVKGYRLILVMPDSMSVERRRLIAAYGAELELTPRAIGMKGAIAKAHEILASTPKGWIPQQFENPANIEVHRRTTATEILRDFPEGLDYLITGVGTGGHITGCGEVLKAKFPQLKVLAVEPTKSPVISGGEHSPHPIQGIGAGFIPKNLNMAILDGVILVPEEEAFDYARRAAREEGIFIGISSGAALAAVARKLPDIPDGARVLTFCYDTGERYLSIDGLFAAGA